MNCSAGSYGAEEGGSDCLACPPGGYSSGNGWTACSECAAGHFQNESNHTGCRSCSPGSFSTALGVVDGNRCASCSPGYHANESASTSCSACRVGTFQTGVGASACGNCRAGTYMAFTSWQYDPCTFCEPGTYSTQSGAVDVETCGLCDDGLYSRLPGQNSDQACRACPLGKVSIPTKTGCRPCPNGTYCPPGYHLPIQCFPGLICPDGASVQAPAGHLPILHGNCTGIIPCPPGTNCTISASKGLLDPYPNKTHFIVFAGGDNQTDLSCTGATFEYGYDRVDWPYNATLYEDSLEILFWLAPLGCPSGMFLLESACVPCPAGMYSTSGDAISMDACQPCPIGAYGPTTAATGCVTCRAGEYGNVSGVSICPACSPTQYSSAGDVQCSSCTPVKQLDPRHACATPRLPQNSSGIWLSVRGGGNTDDCVGIGRSGLSDNSSTLSIPVWSLNPRGQCDHTLQVMGRPDLSRTWIYQRAVLRRPVALRVVPHNDTFYPALCARQGFGVVFTVEDEVGSMYTDLSAAKATITVLDSSGENQLFSMGCTRLPSSLADPVPVGTCYTSYCPTTRVMVRVTIAWTGGSVRGSTLITPGPSVWCGATSSWIAAVELVTPSVPYFPGESIRLYIRALNSPAHLAVFRFALRLLPGVAFVSFQSVYSVVHRVEQDIVSVVGDSSQGTGTVLGVLTLQLQPSVGAGARMAVQVVPGTFQFTLPNTVAYSMLVHTHGFSCRSDGYLQVLVDTPRTTALIAKAKRGVLVHWKRVQSGSGLSITTSIDTIAVQNIMRSYGGVVGQCTSLHPGDLVVGSCAAITATGQGRGNPAASVRVQYQSVSALVNLTVYVPQNMTVWTASAGRSGRFKVSVRLQAGTNLIQDVDATPYVTVGIPTAGLISVQNEQWTCASTSATSFTVGNPALFTGVCDAAGEEPIAHTVFLFTGGTPGLGVFTLWSSELSSEASTGGLLFLSGPHSLPVVSRISPSSSDRVSIATIVGPWLSLVLSGASARCVPVVLGSYTGLIPVFPPAPVSLQISLSATTLVSTNETFTGLLPLSTSVVQAVLVFSDGSTLDVRVDPRFHMTSTGDNLLNLSGLVANSGPDAGNTTLVFGVAGMPCVTTSTTVRVMAFSVQSSVIICSLCPSVLTTPADPLSQQFPAVYPSSMPQSLFVVRRVLADGTILRRFETLFVSGNATLAFDRLLVLSAGYAIVTTNHTTEPYVLSILNRWAVSWRLLCNQRYVCAEDMKLAPPGDGAGLTPFSYTTRLTLSLSLILFDGSMANFSWVAGAAVTSNQTELVGAKEVPLLYGGLVVRAFFDERWQLPQSEYSLYLRVERLAAILVVGPAILYQMHCSSMWEEGNYTASGILTDGVVRAVQPQFAATGPFVVHDGQRGLVHADWAGVGQITAVFGTRSGSMPAQATLSSKYFVSVGLDFLASQWSAPLGQSLSMQPVLTPVFWEAPWFVLSNLTSRVLQWNTTAPDVVDVTTDSLRLLADYYQPVTVSASLVACGGPVFSTSKEVVVNVVPDTPGQIDYGQETGIPTPTVSVGQLLAVPVFIYAPARLRSYTVEIYLDEAVFESVDCTAGGLLNSQCATTGGPDGPVFFRAAGAMLHSQMTGRILVATITGRALQDAVVGMHVRVLQSVMGEQVLSPTEYVFRLRLGTSQLPAGYQSSVVTIPLTTPIAPTSDACGDTDGDGVFTSLDVLFMEYYSAAAVFVGEQQICTVQGRCQLRSQLTAWQLMQLKPVRNPSVPATRPDGSDLLFMLRALVGKAYFLASLEIQSHSGSMTVSLMLRDHMQRVNPSNAVVQIQLSTVTNRDLAFDTPFQYNELTSVLIVDCKRVGQFFVVTSLPTAITLDEASVGMRVATQALDRFGSRESASDQDRRFVFLPSSPIASFNILASTDTLLPETPWLNYLPTTNCQTLCDDASLFLDNTLVPPEWLNATTVTAPFAMYPPSFQGFWTVELNGYTPAPNRYSVSIPANIPPPGAVLVGTRFNMTFQAPVGITMGVFRVENSYATLLRVYDGADAVGNVFFMHTARSTVAHFELSLHQPGIGLPVRVHMLNALPFESFPPNTLAHTALVTGFVPTITGLRVEILCQSGVILWSTLGGTDEPCDVLLTPLWTPGPPNAQSVAGIRVSCQSYPCILQGFSQTVRPAVQTYAPTNPRIMLQRALISVGQRVQWRAVCDLQGGPFNLTVTQRALDAGVVRLSPANALVVTRDSIKGARIGNAVVLFGNRRSNASVGINVTSASNSPHTITGLAFSGVHVSAGQASITAVFQGGPLRAGQQGYLLLRAVFSGGYSILIDPRPAPDGPSIVNASQDVIPSQLDGSFMLRKDARVGLDLAIVTVLYQGLSLTIRADVVAMTPPVVPVVVTTAPPVTIPAPPTTTPALLEWSTTPGAEIEQIAPRRLRISLTGGGITGFYIQFQIEGLVSIQNCTAGRGLPLFSDWSVSSSGGGVILTGASVTPLLNGTELAFVDFNGSYTGSWGFVEVHTGLSATRFPVYGVGSPSDPIARLMPTLPTVDSTTLHRRFSELFPPGNSAPHLQSPLYKAVFALYLLTNKQRNVDARLYSNEFELSAMFRVMDRFLVPDTNRTSALVVTFHTDGLPALPGSVLVPGVGLQVPATHILDGWYVVEWRQQIPVIDGLAVSFTLETDALDYAWPWEVSGSLKTGLRLPSCPRAATDIGTFLVSYEITAPTDIPRALLDRIACSVQVAGRRVMLGPPDRVTGRRLLSIGLESLARVHQANLVVLSDWFTEQLASSNPSGQVLVRRGSLGYINDTRDPPTPCPQGFYYSKNGSYERLPMHAIPGPDCYDLNCIGGYTLALETQQCIPVPVSTDMVWVCVIVVTTVTLLVSAIIFCVQLSAWGAAVEEVVLEPSPVPAAQECQTFPDSGDSNLHFRNIVTGIVLDDYSVMMLDDEFSQVPLDQD